MARLQVPQILSITNITTTPQVISASDLNVTSFMIQAPASNTDFIKVGNLSGQFYQIAPGKDLSVQGDNLDNGTGAYMNLNQWYVSSVAGTQNANIVYLERY